MAANGCSSFLGFATLLLMIGGPLGYSIYIDVRGLLIPGTVTGKHEEIRTRHESWSRSLSVSTSYQPAGELTPSYANTSVDRATFDSLHVGSRVMVRYLPSRSLREFMLIPSARLASRNTFSFLADSPDTTRRVAAVVLGLVALLYLWRKAEMKLAGWLLIPYAAALVLYISIPAPTPSPGGAVQTAHATVSHMKTVTRIFETNRGPGIPALQPFEIVDLEFVPAGWRDPVHAVDEVDTGSIPGLGKGAVVSITYQSDNPRIARMNGGTRTFSEKAVLALLVQGAELVLAVLILGGIWMAISRAGKILLQRIASAAAERRRPGAF